jgi:hypothetical protein
MILWYITLRIACFLDLIHRLSLKQEHGVSGTRCFRNWRCSPRVKRRGKGEALAQLHAEFLTYIPLALSMRSTDMYAV